MTKSRLEIDGVDVGFDSELPISQNLVVADVREPGKANSTFSKTISIPGTAEIKKLFEFIFQVNSTLDSFNPNLKTPARYYVNEVLVFDGSLQLLRINNKYANDYLSTIFECNLIGVNANLFLDIAGLYLTDIDLSDLDHTFTFDSSMFTPTIGEGYAYPFIDYGTRAGGLEQSNVWIFRLLKPAVFELEYINRIIEDAGYTIKSGGYFDTDYAKRIIIPDVNQGTLKMTSVQRADNEAYIGISPDYSQSPISATYGGATYGFAWYLVSPNISLINPVPFNDESNPYSDPNSLWDAVTNYRFTVNDEGDYTVYVNLNISIEIDTYPVGTVTYEAAAGNFEVYIEVQVSNDGGSSWAAVANIPHQFNFNTSVATETDTSLSGSFSGTSFASGALIRVALVQGNNNLIWFKDGGGNILTTGTASAHFNIKEGSVISVKMSTPDLQPGQTVVMNQTIPPNITQLDFITSIIKLENLYFEPSKEIKNQYIVECGDDFFETEASGALDWTDKWDISKGEEIIPMGELDWNRLRFTYKQDQDFHNKKYYDKYKEVYGTEIRDVDNDFVKKEKVIETVFSATPCAGTNLNSIVAPRLYSKDTTTNVVSPIKCNIRRLYWAGLKTTNEFIFVTSVATYRTTYPFVGHVDDPINPTLDLCFDNPYELYWFYPGRTYTDNNRYNERYSKHISEITDQNSKIVRRWFNLTEGDINSFSFRKLVFVRDAYYYVNKIMDYNPQKKSVTQVELLKLKAGSVFVPSTVNIDDLGGDDDVGIFARVANTNNGTGIIIGTGNLNNQGGSFIVGDNNVIG